MPGPPAKKARANVARSLFRPAGASRIFAKGDFETRLFCKRGSLSPQSSFKRKTLTGLPQDPLTSQPANPTMSESLEKPKTTVRSDADEEEPKAKRAKTEEEEEEDGGATEPLKNDDDDAYFELSAKKRCTVRQWKGMVMIDVREVRTGRDVRWSEFSGCFAGMECSESLYARMISGLWEDMDHWTRGSSIVVS